MSTSSEGSWKTTRSIGRECTAGDRRSRPVLTAKRLTTPIRRPPPNGGLIREGLLIIDPERTPVTKARS